MTFGEVLEDSLAIVTDSGQLQSLRLEPLFCVLQLDQLRFAEGSPVGGTEEKQDRALRTFQCVIGLFVTRLIPESKRRSALPDFDADGRRSHTMDGWAFLCDEKARNSDEEQDGSCRFSLVLQIRLRCLSLRGG